MRLLIATRNAHKTAEIAAILGDDWEVSDLTAHPDLPTPEETGTTFAENAAIKALAAAAQFDGLVLADDSGLEVEALGGAPGVISARYAGPGATDADNRGKLRRELAPAFTEGAKIAARFQCAMVLAQGSEVLGTFAGNVAGRIIPEERGEGGFGYDALFIPEGHEATFAQLSGTVKNTLSHRARAMEQVVAFLTQGDPGP